MCSMLGKTRKLTSLLLSVFLFLSLIFPAGLFADEAVIEGNGSDSSNGISINSSSDTEVFQENNSEISNNVTVNLSSGENEVLGTTGEVSIETGEIQTSIAVQNEVNSSVVDTGCCGSEESTAVILGNGSNSQNQITYTPNTSTNININQAASVTNTVQGTSNTGGNKVKNTTGDTSTKTGDIVIAGKVTNGPINTAVVTNKYPAESFDAKIFDNNSNSKNTINIKVKNDYKKTIDNIAWLNSFINWKAETGLNVVKDSAGDVDIQTGDIFFTFEIENGPINVNYIDDNCCPQDEDENPDEPGDEDGNGDGDNDDGGGSGDDSGDGGVGGVSDDAGSSGGSVNGGSIEAAVLGATGNFKENLFYILFTLGAIAIILGVRNEESPLFQK